ncbi:imidazole glycerol phosphate synthase subunit HisH [Acidomonas methanolica]|uniref:Imidazole glycerol phosphate synthase subunit HisH n=2 Tax=Acidomonas methanolica TaxID=437 RepID=A0A023D5M0_ACIMT|nr:imidazole glycerol phosphate synthase subunit HisH [Acidomonas methanolica]MBU2653130.1 imidazole glycerol phosphate synthase subunit HisH [Acidomonas methanolica]TCS32079.1 glutamine amidotransferase [Acidomonas methanolica]GAJ29443.1 imidazole glycerol phosphate synthase subunit HisH [Acidomonas methanolica NBRC 104435]GEK97512.1 imidazole glycerol phosphate synthase subunit HisH [Acidomonas methanolica NBRC 104435]
MTAAPIVIIDYNGGNLASAAQAARRAAADLGLPHDVVISGDPSTVRAASRIILPGQGAFDHCAQELGAGLRDAIEEATREGTPFLGICVGMQLMAERGLEHGVTPGLGWIRGEIAPMDDATELGLRLPHMGWNRLDHTRDSHPLTEGLAADAHGYFVHSYALRGYDEADLVATAEYGGRVPAIVARGNRCGTQFHVEKSQRTGLRIMANFLLWQPVPAT